MQRINCLGSAERLARPVIRGVEVCLWSLLLFAAWQEPAMAQANVQGQWTTLTTQMSINPIHISLMHNGKVFIAPGSGNNPNNLNYMAGVYDPITQTLTSFPVNRDLFCNAMIELPDGRPFVISGTILYNPGFTGDPRNSVYDPVTGTLTDVQPMAHGRWYPTATTLSDGRVMVFSGLDENGNTNTAVEIYKVGVGWSQQYPAGWTPPLYPRMHLLPNGRVFYSGWTTSSALFDPSTNQWQTGVAFTNYAGYRVYGSSVLLPLTPANNYKPVVMVMGGGNPATDTTELIDLSVANPHWVYGPSMSQPRTEMDAVLLPTGKVLAVNGSLKDEDASTSSFNADLYDPATNTFSSAGANSFPRLYHSGAILLPDATVLVVGGNPQQTQYETYTELYSPAYLFNSDGSLATRPSITSVTPGVIGYGAAFQVQTPDAANITSAVLVRPGSVTHAFDMDQRLVGLNFTVGSGQLNLTSPPNSSIAPPGYYMLFLLNSAGVPSKAVFVQLSLQATDQPPKGTITSPSSNISIGVGQSVSFSGTGTDTDGTITGYSWIFPGGNPSSGSVANPGNVVYSTPGTYIASLTVTDNVGATDPSPATLTVTVLPAFTLSASPTGQVVAPNASTSFSVSVQPGSNTSGTVSFNVTGLPTGATATFSPATVNASGGSTTLTVATNNAASGVYPLKITGTNGTASATVNVTLGVGGVAPPVITPITDTYTLPVSVTLTSTTSGATLYFTTDGTTPIVTPSELYTAPFTLSASAVVEAMAVKSGFANSSVSTVNYKIQAGVAGCPCTIWPRTATPGTQDTGPGQPVELGVRFSSLFNGFVTGIRFYKGLNNTGTHVGNLWNSTGTLLASATFTGETASGWQQVNFSSPVAITANTVYIASYFSPTGDFAVDRQTLGSGVNNPPLSALADGNGGGGNGLYTYGSSSQFPVSSYLDSNYWVDLVYSTTASGAPLTVATASLPGGSVGVAYNQTMAAGGGASPYTWTLVSGSNLPAGLSLSTAGVISGTPTAIGTTSFTVQVADSSSPRQFAQATLSITIATAPPPPPPPTCPCTIWPNTTTPGTTDSGAGPSLELGVRFTSSSGGFITGIRFYKGVNNTGVHTGHLWTSTGTLLGTATFTGETAAGWQQASLSSPVAITANTVYVASYFSPSGDFAVDRSYFSTAGVSSPPLQALADGGAGAGDGLYMYGATSQFPSNSFQSSNYWVDVVYNTTAGGAPLTVATTSPLPGGTQGVAYNQTLAAGGGTSPYSWTLVSGSSLPAGLSLSTGGVISGTPTGTGTTSFTVQVTDSSSPVQTAQATLSITIATAPPPPTCPCTIWPATVVPGTPDTGTGPSLELGVRFTSSSGGFITGIRFYKGVSNTGTHTGHLWSNTGTLLGTATFTGETASGWQQANFSSPVAITANTVYVASYFSPSGDFAADRSYFATAGVSSPPLQALADGGAGAGDGLYKYGAKSQFPTSSFQSSNYWVDVVFTH